MRVLSLIKIYGLMSIWFYNRQHPTPLMTQFGLSEVTNFCPTWRVSFKMLREPASTQRCRSWSTLVNLLSSKCIYRANIRERHTNVHRSLNGLVHNRPTGTHLINSLSVFDFFLILTFLSNILTDIDQLLCNNYGHEDRTYVYIIFINVFRCIAILPGYPSISSEIYNSWIFPRKSTL